MTSVTLSQRNIIQATIVLIAACIINAVITLSAHASIPGWSAGNIMGDGVFTNKNTMNTGQIQNFLDSKVPSCDTYGTQPSEYGGGTRAQWAQAKYGQSTFTCLRNYNEGGKSAAQIIYDKAQQYSINPQVLIVLLQKEQGLVTDTWPLNIQYRSATGYGCPDTAPCDSQYYGLANQLDWAAKMFRAIMNASPTWYTPYVLGNNTIRFNPNASCGSTNVIIQNRATQALYNYTPYQPNSYALNGGTSSAYPQCGAFGNRNFYTYFTSWFGSTRGYLYGAVDYTNVFDPTYYATNNPDISALYGTDINGMFLHYLINGLNEGRQGNADFNVASYKNRYADLRASFGDNLLKYATHYSTIGKAEGRVATGDYRGGTTFYNGVDYSSVYNFDYYTRTYPDVWSTFGWNDKAALQHFIVSGLNEGRQGNADFNVASYKNRYADLRASFGDNLPRYASHYAIVGKNEGRTATGDVRGGTTLYNGVDYSSIYNFDYYTRNHADVWNTFGWNDKATLQHFIVNGIKEGRQATTDFNVIAYKNKYADLQASFGDNLLRYASHYVTNGKAEGRTAL